MEYIIGNFVGLTQTLIGYPFDTIKTNIQNGNNLKLLNYRNIYNGIKYP